MAFSTTGCSNMWGMRCSRCNVITMNNGIKPVIKTYFPISRYSCRCCNSSPGWSLIFFFFSVLPRKVERCCIMVRARSGCMFTSALIEFRLLNRKCGYGADVVYIILLQLLIHCGSFPGLIFFLFFRRKPQLTDQGHTR